MSKFVKIQTELRDVEMIKQSLADLKFEYQENAQYVHMWSGFKGKVPFLVKNKRTTFGLRTTDDGIYEVIGDDMEMRQIEKMLQQIQQRYAYHTVKTETEKAGFALVEENVGRDNVIRMTVRRWS